MEKLLTEVCAIQYGFPFDSAKFSENEGVPLIRIRDVVRGFSETYTTEEYKEEYLVHEGDLLIGMDGEFNIAKWGKVPSLLNQRVCRLIPLENIDKGYLFYFMPTALKRIEDKTPFVTVKHLSAKELNKVKVPLPPLEEQRKIAAVLDKVSDLIAKRRQQLEKLDLLVKARFVEMFKQIQEMSRLEEYTILITKGASPKWQGIDYAEYGTLFITSENVREGYLDLSRRKYLDSQINEIQPRSILKKDDILINIVGASIGRAAVYDLDDLANINQAVALVRLRKNMLNQKFLLTFLNSAKALELYDSMKKGGARDNLSLKNIADLPIPKAPLDLQNQFSVFVEQTEQTKTSIKTSLAKLETLKKALMQEYFG